MADKKHSTQRAMRSARRNPDAGLTDLIHGERARSRPVAGVIHVGASDQDQEVAAWEIEQGTDVLCQHGEKVGEVLDIRDDYLVVEQGFFMPHDIYLPVSMVASLDDTGLHLKLSRDQFDDVDWSHEPPPEAPDS